MAYYQLYRPQRFDQLIGQEFVVKALLQALSSQRLVQAYLFSGGRGTGKTSTARIFSRAINCQAPTLGEPCNLCEACLAMLNGRAMDLIEIDAASHRGIDETRRLLEQLKFPPQELVRKIVIIDEAHMLTKEANNALLKTLEEPPSHLIIILATTEPRKLLPTIISRCQHYRFQLPEPSQLVEAMRRVAKDKELEVTDDGLLLLAELAHGSYRDALGLLERLALRSQPGQSLDRQAVTQELGLPELQLVDQLLDLMTSTVPVPARLASWWESIEAYRQRGGQLNELLEASLTQLERRLVAGQAVPPGLVARMLQANRLKQGLPLGHDWLVLHYLLNDISPVATDTEPRATLPLSQPSSTSSKVSNSQPTQTAQPTPATPQMAPILQSLPSEPAVDQIAAETISSVTVKPATASPPEASSAETSPANDPALTPAQYKQGIAKILQSSELPKTVLTILKSTELLSFAPPRLELSVSFELHKTRLMQPAIRQQLEQELTALFERPIAVMLTVQKPEHDLASQAEALLGGSGL
ncbi:MAG: DNA polymerase III subunit gamma/tau [Candidatus Berkelbacteria bacterium Gr01-1014_85]|uniref:DNA polymerase III subunit gamma/tau n=1 Tax=Candidatus Berkelbacteria bacterium Gr01-1014_85 TaxID=2017150 RepID=A0A554JAV2_9BACT|nr:MAG: DNA polymerase III subunit gamma/tau [Candidatus Berkelbacteria bacterium Gr01-1014_85]